MSWENEYKSKLTTAEKAVELIKSGNRVVIGHACAEPSYLVCLLYTSDAADE